MGAEIVVLPLMGDTQKAEDHAQQGIVVFTFMLKKVVAAIPKTLIRVVADLQLIDAAVLHAAAAMLGEALLAEAFEIEAVDLIAAGIQTQRHMGITKPADQVDQVRHGIGVFGQNDGDTFHKRTSISREYFEKPMEGYRKQVAGLLPECFCLVFL